MIYKNSYLLLLLLFLSFFATSLAQNTTYINSQLEQISYLENIENTNDSSGSYLIRSASISSENVTSKRFKILPFGVNSVFNSSYPFGWANGIVLKAKGVQNSFFGGVYIHRQNVEMQFKPELLVAQDLIVDYNSRKKKSVNEFFAGESFIKYNIKGIQIGISNESIWWRLCFRNSLVMSNNSPGFFHYRINTRYPIKTKLGNFEFQLLGGILKSRESDNFEIFDNNILEKAIANRYVNGYVLIFQPRFIPNMFLGITRSMQMYARNHFKGSSNPLVKLFPVLLSPLQRKNTLDDDSLIRDQLGSLFFKATFPSKKIDIFLEYGYNDYFFNFRDLTLNLPHSAAYILSIKKMFNNKALVFETMRMSPISPMVERPGAGSWYLHFQINEGYTHRGQTLGSAGGLGVSSTSLTFFPNVYKKFLKISVESIKRKPYMDQIIWRDNLLEIGFYKKFSMLDVELKTIFVSSNNYFWISNNRAKNFFTSLRVAFNL